MRINPGISGSLGAVMRAARSLPGAKHMVEAEKAKMMKEIEADIRKKAEEMAPFGRYPTLPKEGVDKDTILASLRKLRELERDYKAGKAVGGTHVPVHVCVRSN